MLGLHTANLHHGLIAALFTAVGRFVVRRRPEHREGWLFVATGLTHAVMYVGRQYGLHEAVLPGAAWIGWIPGRAGAPPGAGRAQVPAGLMSFPAQTRHTCNRDGRTT